MSVRWKVIWNYCFPMNTFPAAANVCCFIVSWMAWSWIKMCWHSNPVWKTVSGKVPREGQELLRIVPLRRMAKRLGAEKVFLKAGRMTLFFVSNPDSPYYQSAAFGKVIDYMGKNPRYCNLREQNGKRSMVIKNVETVETAVGILQEIVSL